MGPERRSMIISDKDKRVTAYHEAGHALVGKMMKGSDPVHKVTIIPRGRALGLTQQLPAEDRLNISTRVGQRSDRGRDGRPRRRGADLPPDDHRRVERHPGGDRSGAQDGVRVGHVREAGAAPLRQARGRGLPRPRLRRRRRRSTASRRRSRSTPRCAGSSPRTTTARSKLVDRQPRQAQGSSPRRCSSTRPSTAPRSTPSSRAGRLERKPVATLGVAGAGDARRPPRSPRGRASSRRRGRCRTRRKGAQAGLRRPKSGWTRGKRG